MTFFLISFLAGALTVLAPCVLPVLPVIIGGSISDHQKRNPLIITAALGVSVVAFTLLLKFSTALIDVPQKAWALISGSIIFFFGLISLFPTVWQKIIAKTNILGASESVLAKSASHKNRWGDVLIGAALGPVFSSCSPTYFVILASVLPESFARGLVYLIGYALGLSLVLLLIGYLGQRVVKKLSFAANPNGWFKRGLGVLFIAVGIFIITGGDKKLQIYLVNSGLFDITKTEQRLLQSINGD